MITKEPNKNINDKEKNSIEVSKRIAKTLEIYKKSYMKKRNLNNTLERIKENPSKYNLEESAIKKAFGAKDFFKNLDDCGSWLEFRHYKEHDKVKLHRGNFCRRDKLCRACAIRRAYKQQNRFLQIIESEEFKNKDWYYIVIPVKHTKQDTFEEVYSKIENIKKRIVMQVKNGKRGMSKKFFTRFQGGIYSTEVTYSANGWNVHINLLLNCERGTDLGVFEKHGKTLSSAEISDFLKPYDSYVNSITKVDFSTHDSIKSNLLEILKYSLKFSDLSDEKLIEVYVKTYRKRLFGAWGNLRGKGIEDAEIEENTSGEVEEIVYIREIEKGKPSYKLYRRVERKEVKGDIKEDKPIMELQNSPPP